MAAAVEQDCQHPVAEAIKRYAKRYDLARHEGSLIDVQRTGVIGRVDRVKVCVGNLSFIRHQGIQIGAEVLAVVEQCARDAASPIVVAVGGVVEAVLAISDPLRPGVAMTIANLKRRGWKVGILSGDHPAIVDHVASQIGIDPGSARGGMSPEEKLAAVRRHGAARRGATTVMVGDGANDAAALAAADVGVAVRGGAEVSLQAAPVFIASGEIEQVDQMIHSATRTDWLIRTAFAVSLTYNLAAVGLAMMGKISPLIAAVLMPISSVSVLALTLAWPTYPDSDVTEESNS